MSLFRVDVDPAAETAAFAGYLCRLGCTVVEQTNGYVAAHVTYTETVDDEPRAVAEWCASWSRPGRTAVCREPTPVSAT